MVGKVRVGVGFGYLVSRSGRPEQKAAEREHRQQGKQGVPPSDGWPDHSGWDGPCRRTSFTWTKTSATIVAGRSATWSM